MNIDPTVAAYFRLLVCLISLGLFVWSHYLILSTKWGTNGNPAQPNDQLNSLSVSTAGLVGGVSSMMFGLSPAADNPPSGLSIMQFLGDKVTGLGSFFKPLPGDLPQILAWIYVLVYILIGLWAIIVDARGTNPTDVTKNLALVARGMFIAIATGLFKV